MQCKFRECCDSDYPFCRIMLLWLQTLSTHDVIFNWFCVFNDVIFKAIFKQSKGSNPGNSAC